MSNLKDNSMLHDQLLKCPICFEIFGNLNKPIIIPCGHTICSICIDKIIKNDSLNQSLNSESNSLSDQSGSNSFIRIDSFEESDSIYEESNEDSDEEMDSNNHESLNEEEINDRDNMELVESNNSDYSDNNNNILNNTINGNNYNSRENKVKKDESEKIIKINCSICRKKSKTQRKNLIVNAAILDLIKSLLEGETITEERDNIIFCVECCNRFKENIHKYEYPNHEIKSFNIDYFTHTLIEFNKFEKKINNILYPFSKKILIKLIEKMKKTNLKFEKFMKEFSAGYNIFYFINYLETKLMKIYIEYQEAIKENNFKEMEISLSNVETIVNKFFLKMFIPSIIQENFMKSNEIRKEFNDYVKNSLYYKLHSINQNRIKTDRKYLIVVNDNKIYIYDIRTKSYFNIKYYNIFDVFESKEKKQQKKNYDIEKNYTEYVEISENGRYIMMIGKNDEESKKFRVYDIYEHKLIKKPNMSIKLSSIDMIYYDKKLFILGGLNQEGYVTHCEYFDFSKDKWFPLPSLNIARELKSILVINENLVTYFGDNEDPNVDINTFESLNLRNLKNENLSWESFKIKNLNQEFSYNGMNSVLNDNIFFIFGGVTKDDEEPIQNGFLIDFNKREVITEIKLDKKHKYISAIISSTYGNVVCGVNNETVEELAEFSLSTLNIK